MSCHSVSISKSVITLCLALMASLLVLCGGAAPAYAHRPHDVVTQVALSPTYNQDSTLFILVRNGLFRSRDGGDTWQRLSNGLDNQGNLAVLEISASDQQILYTGANDDRIYRSTDGGDSWGITQQGLENQAVNWLQIAPNNPDVVFAHTEEGILFKTNNGGEAWVPILSNTTATDLAFNADGQFLILGDDLGQLQQSEDGGETWIPLASLPTDTVIQHIVLSPNFDTDKTFLVATAEDGIYRTLNGGQSIEALNQGLADLRVQDVLALENGTYLASTWDDGYWFWQSEAKGWVQSDSGLTRDPMANDLEVPHFEDLEVSNEIAFLGGFDGLFRSTDGGNQWEELETLSLGSVISLSISPTFADDNTLAVATYVGEIYISRDRGETWEPVNDSLYLPKFTGNFKPLVLAEGDQDPRRFFDIALSGQGIKENQLFTSLLYTKILHSDKIGKSWSITNLDKEVRGVALALSPDFENDQTIFSSSQADLIYRSTDAGQSFQRVGKVDKQQGNDAPSTVLSPNFADDKTLFTTGELGVYRSTDAGVTWTSLTEGKALDEDAGIQLAISSNYKTDKTLFATSRAGLYRSTDAGDSWENITSHFLEEATFMEAIAVSPNYAQDKTLIVSPRGKPLFKSTDGGETFSPINIPNLTIARMTSLPSAGRSLQFSPNYAEDNTLFGFGAAETEIYRSTNGGENWKILSIPRHQINQIRPPGILANVKMLLDINQGKIKKISALLVSILIVIGGLKYVCQRRWLTFLSTEVQSNPSKLTYDSPKVLKIIGIALITIHLIFALANLRDTPYNADEVRGFYRMSGYTEAEIKAEAFQGSILTGQQLLAYQQPSSERSFSDAVKALAGNPEHTPLYYVAGRFWMQLWGSPFSTRILSVLLGFIALPFAYWLGLELFKSGWVGWINLAIMSVSPYQILLSRGSRQYGLWILVVLASSVAFLRALRLGNRSSWVMYTTTLVIGLYSHLFFLFTVAAHGLYGLLFEWRRPKSHLYPLIGSLGASFIAFMPWVWVVFTRLEDIDQKTQWVQSRKSSLNSIIRISLSNIGNVFVDLNQTTRWENYADLLIIAIVVLATYCLLRFSPPRTWAFILLPIFVTGAMLAVPDIFQGGGRSLQSRYLLPAFLSIELAVSYFLSNSIQKSKYAWEKSFFGSVFTLLILLGILSGVAITKSPDWDYLNQGQTASVKNLEIAPIINASKNPLVISGATHSFILALVHEVDERTKFQLLQGVDSEEWPSLIQPWSNLDKYSDIFLYYPDNTLLNLFEEAYGLVPEPVNGNKMLYRLPKR